MTQAAEKKSWYRVSAKAESLELQIMDEIGAWGVSADSFIVSVREKIKTAKTVVLSINSPGGSLFDGVALYNFLRAYRDKLDVEILGVAASAASLIALAGRSLTMYDGSFLMIHDPWSFVVGGVGDMEKEIELLGKIKKEMVTIYAVNTALSEIEISDLMAAETWIAARDAESEGWPVTYVASAVAASIDIEALGEQKYQKIPDAIRAKKKGGAMDAQNKEGQSALDKTVTEGVAAGVDRLVSKIDQLLASQSVMVHTGRQTLPGAPDATDGKIVAANGRKIQSAGEYFYAALREPDSIRATLVSSESAAGGYLLPQVYVDEILKVPFEGAHIYNRSTKFRGTLNSVTMPGLDQSGVHGIGAAANPAALAEGAVIPEVTPVMRTMTLTPRLVGYWVDIGPRVAAEANIIQTMSEFLGARLVDFVEWLFFQGTAANEPKGFSVNPAASIVNRTTLNRFTLTDAVRMIDRLLPQNMARAAWYISKAAMGEVRNMLDAQNNRVFVPKTGPQPYDYLLGLPIIETTRSRALGTPGDVCLADFSQYLVHDGLGVQIAVSPDAAFTSGGTALRATWHVDGRPATTGPVTTPVGALSSFVTLGAV